MQDNALHHLPVLDTGGTLVGILAERDLLLAATRFLQSAIEVGEVMHRNVVTAAPDMPITDAATLMVRHKIGGLPVVDGDRELVGIITETDILKAFVDVAH
jgi:acetoin utilization protein AcuB